MLVVIMNKKAIMHVQRALHLSFNDSKRSFGTGGRQDERQFKWWYTKPPLEKQTEELFLTWTDMSELWFRLVQCNSELRVLKYSDRCNEKEDFKQYKELRETLRQLTDSLQKVNKQYNQYRGRNRRNRYTTHTETSATNSE